LDNMSVGQDKPNGKNRSTTLESAAKQAEVVKLRLAGHTLDEIATRVGLAGRQGAHYHVAKWIESLQPSSELAEEFRQTQLARAEERYRRLSPKALGQQDPETGEWLVEPDYQALAAIQRDSERMSRMLGADLQVGVAVMQVTAEGLAAVLGLDPGVIDVDADELPVEADLLLAGDEPHRSSL
jgi:hypothetical protein